MTPKSRPSGAGALKERIPDEKVTADPRNPADADRLFDSHRTARLEANGQDPEPSDVCALPEREESNAVLGNIPEVAMAFERRISERRLNFSEDVN